MDKKYTLGKYADKFYLFCAWLAGALLVCMCVLVLWSILARLIGEFSRGTTHMAGYFMAASTFLALAYTYRSHGHIRVELFFKPLQITRIGRMVSGFCLLCMAATTSYLAFYLSKLAFDAYIYEERSEGADAILLFIPQSIIAFGAIIFCISVWHSFIEFYLRKTNLSNGSPGESLFDETIQNNN